MGGTTDNQGNSYAGSRLMTTRFPLNAVLMEIAARMCGRNVALDLRWAPRDQNFEADELSNSIKHRFNPLNEVKIKVEELDFLVLPEMLKKGRKLYEAVQAGKEQRRAAKQAGFETRSRKKSKAARLRITDPW